MSDLAAGNNNSRDAINSKIVPTSATAAGMLLEKRQFVRNVVSTRLTPKNNQQQFGASRVAAGRKPSEQFFDGASSERNYGQLR